MMDVQSLSAVDAEGRTPVFETPYTVVLGLDAGEEVPEHTHPGNDVLFAVFEGELDLTVGEETATLGAGEVARFDGAQDISVAARTAVRALVVFAEQ